MQLNNAQTFLNGLSAGGISPGLDPGEFNIKDASGYKFSFIASQVKTATVLKRFDGVTNVWKAKFSAPDAADSCCENIRKSGLTIRLIRNVFPHVDHETYLDTNSTKYFLYPHEENKGPVTAQQLATTIAAQINYKDGYNPGSPYIATIDPTDDTAVLITALRPDFPIEVWTIEDGTAVEITEVTPPKRSVLSEDDMIRRFPLGVNYIPGKGTDYTWQGGRNPAIVTLSLAVDSEGPKNLAFNYHQNALHGYGGAWGSANIELWLDCNDAGYQDFIDALNAAIPVEIQDITPTA